MTHTVDQQLEGFDTVFEATEDEQGNGSLLNEVQAVRELPAGSLVRDYRQRILFRTRANGWVSINSTHFSSVHLALPVEVLHYGDVPALPVGR